MNAIEKPSPAVVARLMLTPNRRPQSDNADHANWIERVLDIEGANGNLHIGLAGQGPLICFVHGWEGSSNDFSTLIRAVLTHGFSVAALDLPAHGHSSGSFTSIPACANALLEVQVALGQEFYAVIAHSLGAAVTGEALSLGLRAHKVVLVSPPRRYQDAVDAIVNQIGFDAQDKLELISALHDLGVDPAAIDLTQAVSKLTQTGLIFHSDDDRVIPIQAAESVAAAWAGSRMVRLSGLGHRRLLSDPLLNQTVVDFLGSAQGAST